MKKIYLIFAMLVSYIGASQSISEYKYAIVASTFSAQKKPGQFGLNKLTLLFLEKNGYKAYLDTDILPEQVAAASCDKIFVDVVEDGGIMMTKLKVVIKDCKNEVLFVSEEGKSREKDNNVAYNLALRAAFKSFDKPEFRHDPSVAEKKGIDVEKKAVVVPSVVKSADKLPNETVLYAQPFENGFQLVDSTPKVVMKILKTSQPDVFMISGQNNGMLVQKNGQWFHEYYEGEDLISLPINVKF